MECLVNILTEAEIIDAPAFVHQKDRIGAVQCENKPVGSAVFILNEEDQLWHLVVIDENKHPVSTNVADIAAALIFDDHFPVRRCDGQIRRQRTEGQQAQRQNQRQRKGEYTFFQWASGLLSAMRFIIWYLRIQLDRRHVAVLYDADIRIRADVAVGVGSGDQRLRIRIRAEQRGSRAGCRRRRRRGLVISPLTGR